MVIDEAINYLTVIRHHHPTCNVTFANNKVPVSKIVYDETTNTVNLR